VTITVRDVTVAEQISGPKATVAALHLNGGLKNAFTVNLNQATKLLAKRQTADAVGILRTDFIGQVNDLSGGGELTQTEAHTFVTAAWETIRNIDL
jgi:hypothetical protein